MSLNLKDPIIRSPLLIAGALLGIANASLADECGTRVEREAALMGTTLRISVCAPTQDAGIAATEAAFREVRRLNGVLSSWTSESEVGRFNTASAAQKTVVSPELYALLREAGHWVAATKGAFDPAVGALVDAWRLRSGGHTPDSATLAAARERTGWHYLRLHPDNVIARGPAGWWLDTGGFGKGAALRGAAETLRRFGIAAAELDFGGQLLVFGKQVTVGVADPAHRAMPVVALDLNEASVSTSSQSEQANHVLDPRTGQPVPAWGSVTVVCADAFAADALSTALFVMGPRAALEWGRSRSDIGVLILETTSTKPRASWNDAMARLIVKE